MTTRNQKTVFAIGSLAAWFVLTAASTLLASAERPRPQKAAPVLMPAIDGEWWQVAGDPDLGDLTSPDQQPVDFAVWQAADGTWQLWSCIRKTKCGGNTRLFYRWEGRDLTAPDWQPMGIAMQADPKLGESPGGLQAPHVVKVDETYHMFYGDWQNICHATSQVGKTFQRVVQPDGRTGMFSEGPGANTRDVMMLPVDGLWHAYYTAFPNRQGAVYCRTTRDFKTWSDSKIVSFGGQTGTGATSAECPHVVFHQGRFYLFRTQRYGPNNKTSVYHSTDPQAFGINRDERYYVGWLPIAAPEILMHHERMYVAALNLDLKGIRIARLKWAARPKRGTSVFNLDDPSVRKQWRQVKGDIASVFTSSTRHPFGNPYRFFVGTAETASGAVTDVRQGVIESPPFVVSTNSYFVLVSGGSDPKTTYVALVDEETGDMVARVSGPVATNQLTEALVDTTDCVGRRMRIRIVDRATESWGHINFGGLYENANAKP